MINMIEEIYLNKKYFIPFRLYKVKLKIPGKNKYYHGIYKYEVLFNQNDKLPLFEIYIGLIKKVFNLLKDSDSSYIFGVDETTFILLHFTNPKLSYDKSDFYNYEAFSIRKFGIKETVNIVENVLLNLFDKKKNYNIFNILEDKNKNRKEKIQDFVKIFTSLLKLFANPTNVYSYLSSIETFKRIIIYETEDKLVKPASYPFENSFVYYPLNLLKELIKAFRRSGKEKGIKIKEVKILNEEEIEYYKENYIDNGKILTIDFNWSNNFKFSRQSIKDGTFKDAFTKTGFLKIHKSIIHNYSSNTVYYNHDFSFNDFKMDDYAPGFAEAMKLAVWINKEDININLINNLIYGVNTYLLSPTELLFTFRDLNDSKRYFINNDNIKGVLRKIKYVKIKFNKSIVRLNLIDKDEKCTKEDYERARIDRLIKLLSNWYIRKGNRKALERLIELKRNNFMGYGEEIKKFYPVFELSEPIIIKIFENEREKYLFKRLAGRTEKLAGKEFVRHIDIEEDLNYYFTTEDFDSYYEILYKKYKNGIKDNKDHCSIIVFNKDTGEILQF